MAWRAEKNENGGRDLVWSGMENGVAPSPHKGNGNLQNVNLSTETKEIMCSFSRTMQTATGTTSTIYTITPVDTSHLATSFALPAGVWINISASTISGLSTGNYYVTRSSASNTSFQISSYYNSTVATGFGATGTATFTLIRVMGLPIASDFEKYTDVNNVTQYRYYILDNQSLVWVYDTAQTSFYGYIKWFLPDYDIATIGSNATGMRVLNGWLHVFAGNTIWCKPTVNLGNTTAATTTWASFSSGVMLSMATSPNPHFAFVGHQGKLYYTDGNFIGSIFPSTSLLTGAANIQSYASYTTSTTTGTIANLIGGSLPTTSTTSIRIPATFFPLAGYANPTALTAGTIYYIAYSTGASTFQVFAAASGGAALDITTGATGGTYYFNTYNPTSAGGETTITFTPQRLNLPFFETAQSIIEIGDMIIIGGKTNTLYPWNQVDPTPGDLIQLPENDVHYMIGVNNMAYIFAGHKGNVYITNGSTASLVITIPDYTAGIAGTPSSYIEPYFTWGGADYIRGRIYCSIQDQTSTKAGNCGGVWSFVPTQNFFFGQDTGLSLRMENTNSYGTLNGMANIIMQNQNQAAVGVQYFSAWTSSISSPTYGIDTSGTVPNNTAIVETDFVPTGTMLDKKTFSRIEYKVSSPLLSGESIVIQYRLNSTDAWSSFTTTLVTDTALSGYYASSFQLSQWLQLRAQLIPNGSPTFSGNRLTELRVVT
jgi:hypothetical protein